MLREIQETEDNPFEIFKSWYDIIIKDNQFPQPSYMILSTVNDDGQPSSRVVLLKNHSPKGFVFYTNYNSRKCLELFSNPKASLLFYWWPYGKQVRVEGDVEKISPTESDKYFQSRPYGSQIGALASNQSQEIESIETLQKRANELQEKYPKDVPRPEHWGGLILKPKKYEFWSEKEHRLHERVSFTKTSPEKWSRRLLQP